MKKKLYKTLNIDEKATQDEIKNAYRKKAKENHPDKNGNVEEMKKVNQAYAILKNPLLKEQYDKTGDENNSVNNEFAQIMNYVIELSNLIVKENPSNITKWLKNKEKALKQNFDLVLLKNKKEKADLNKFLGRIKKHPINDFIGETLHFKIDNIDRNIYKLEQEYELRIKAFNFFKDYEFTILENSEWTGSFFDFSNKVENLDPYFNWNSK